MNPTLNMPTFLAGLELNTSFKLGPVAQVALGNNLHHYIDPETKDGRPVVVIGIISEILKGDKEEKASEHQTNPPKLTVRLRY